MKTHSSRLGLKKHLFSEVIATGSLEDCQILILALEPRLLEQYKTGRMDGMECVVMMREQATDVTHHVCN